MSERWLEDFRRGLEIDAWAELGFCFVTDISGSEDEVVFRLSRSFDVSGEKLARFERAVRQLALVRSGIRADVKIRHNSATGTDEVVLTPIFGP